MIFPSLEFEPIVQVGDKTRLDALKSFVTPDEQAISVVSIRPSSADGFINVSNDRYLDWAYSASGVHEITVLVSTTAGASASAQIVRNITSVTSAQDKLFSTDQDLRLHEPDILKWVVDGRSTFKDVHRRAQYTIIRWLDKEGYVDVYNNPFTKDAILDLEEVKQWSTFIALRLIFEGISNAIDDIFADKAKRYKGKEVEWRKRAILRLDINGDGKAEDGEGVDPAYGFIARR
jgi:hypothetical protein